VVAGFQSPAEEQVLSVESLPHFCSPGAQMVGWHCKLIVVGWPAGLVILQNLVPSFCSAVLQA
jgi:hypothetical protein